MIRFLELLLLVVLACKVLTGRWPWQYLAVSSQSQADRQARALLGIGRNANRIEIIEAHRRLIAMVHPDRGGTSDQVIEANAARDLLLGALAEHNPEQK